MYGGTPYAGGPYAGTLMDEGDIPSDGEIHTAVEVAFATAPLSESPAFVDIAGDCRWWDVNRGRSGELERFPGGRCSIQLSNLARQYDSVHAAGPWFGYLKSMRRVRVRETVNGVTYPTFDGFVDRWQLDYPDVGRDATATITATDLFKILARTDLPPSVYYMEVMADAPIALWRLGDPAYVENAADVIGTRELAFVDSPDGGEALVTNDPNGSTFFDHPDEGSGNVVEAPVPTPIPTFPFTIEAVFRSVKRADNLSRTLVSIGASGRLVDVFISDNVSGGAGELTIALTDDNYASFSQFGTSGVRVDDGRIHHLLLSFKSATVVEAWIDGTYTALGGATKAVALPAGTVQVALGNASAAYPFAGEYGLDGELQDVAIYNKVLSDARIAVHAAARAHPWQGDLPGVRADRILDLAGIPADMRALDPGDVSFQSAATDGQTVLEHAQKIAETELALFFASKDGRLTLVDKFSQEARVSTVVFGDGPGEVGYRDISPDDGDRDVRNRATISRLNGVAKTATDGASVVEFGFCDYSLDGLLHDSDAYSQSYADWVVTEFGDQRRRIKRLEVGPPIPEEEDEVWPVVLGLELGQLVTVRSRPPGGGDMFEQVCVVEGLHHLSRPGEERSVVVTLSPEFSEPLF